MHQPSRPGARLYWALPIVFAALAATGSVGPAVAEVLPLLGAQDFYDLVPPRDREVVEEERNLVLQAQAAADLEAAQARGALEQERGLVDIKKKEIDTIKARIDQADKEKNQEEKAAQEQLKKAQEVEQKLLERRVEMRGRERAEAEARKKAAQAEAVLLGLEADLLGLREKVAELRGSEPPAEAQKIAAAELRVREGQRAVLGAALKSAELREEAAEELGELIEARIKVLEAQAVALTVRG